MKRTIDINLEHATLRVTGKGLRALLDETIDAYTEEWGHEHTADILESIAWHLRDSRLQWEDAAEEEN